MDKVDIVKLGFDDDFIKELKREFIAEDGLKMRIVRKLKEEIALKTSKKKIEKVRWYGLYGMIFDTLLKAHQENTTTPRSVIAQIILDNTIDQSTSFLAIMSRFSRYLRTEKDDVWALSRKHKSRETYYFLIRF